MGHMEYLFIERKFGKIKKKNNGLTFHLGEMFPKLASTTFAMQ